jgi:uncharacterized membrane protein YqaE (UPF0057 family)
VWHEPHGTPPPGTDKAELRLSRDPSGSEPRSARVQPRPYPACDLHPAGGELVTTGFGIQFLLNILLWVLGWLPGTVHALWLMNRERPLL